MSAAWCGAAAVGLALVLAPAPRAAAQCDDADVTGTAPEDGATGIPTDALLHARYGLSAIYSGEPVILEGPDGPVTLLPVFDPSEGALIVTPDVMHPRATYTVRWPALLAGGTTATGTGATVTFTTADGTDTGPPAIGEISSIDWWVRREIDGCTEDRIDRWFFDLEIDGLTDDGGRGGLEVLVLQTHHEGLDDVAPFPVGVSGVPEDGDTVRIRLARERGLGESCFAAVARDLVGNVSPATEPVCVKTIAAPYFDGCSISSPVVPAPVPALFLLSLVSLGRTLRRRSAAPDRRAGRTHRAGG